jgi:hypothetical protein
MQARASKPCQVIFQSARDPPKTRRPRVQHNSRMRIVSALACFVQQSFRPARSALQCRDHASLDNFLHSRDSTSHALGAIWCPIALPPIWRVDPSEPTEAQGCNARPESGLAPSSDAIWSALVGRSDVPFHDQQSVLPVEITPQPIGSAESSSDPSICVHVDRWGRAVWIASWIRFR